ncbi:GntR family transcriptional regulator [Clostridium algidicarnis]|uniref:GntR family transcriptional regulator n=1 Tax=Clostridium algidicarnis TaxID=37659 RepID=UPI003FD88238
MFTIDSKNNFPIYKQIINSVKESIIKGMILPGDKLPSVRELAKLLTTNPNTVSKAYNELERMHIIETLRGKGTFVAIDYIPKIEAGNMLKLKDEIKKVLMDAHYMGLKKDDINGIFNELYDELLNDKDTNITKEDTV